MTSVQFGKRGESIARNVCKGRRTRHKHPFDMIDCYRGIAYEVKTFHANDIDLKVHIHRRAFERKLAYVREHGLIPVLVAVVLSGITPARVYQSGLKQSIRVNQMTRIS